MSRCDPIPSPPWLLHKLAQRIGPGKYPVLTRRTTLPAPVDDGASIRDTALALWRAVHAGKTVRLIEVSVGGIEASGPAQLALFPPREAERQTALNQAVDKLAARFPQSSCRAHTVDPPAAFRYEPQA